MKAVVDTNVVLSGLLWTGPPNRLLRWARRGIIEVLTCEEAVEELKRVLEYRKFGERLKGLGATPREVLAYFMNLAHFVPNPESVPSEITEDPFDNLFLALALENSAHLIVSGDHHLIQLREYRHIQIVIPSEACRVIEKSGRPE